MDTVNRPRNSIQVPRVKSLPGASVGSASKGRSGSNASVKVDESIDELFQNLKSVKRKRLDKSEIERKSEAAQRRKAKEAKKSAFATSSLGEPFRLVSPEAPVHRIDDATGLPVYKAHLLKVGEGGGTPLCPFDCNCCF